MITDQPKKPWFIRQLSFDSLLQSATIVVAFVTWGAKLDARISQLEQVKVETKAMIQENYKELRESQARLADSHAKLSEAVTRLIVMEEMRQRQPMK